ncbi:MAG: sigma-70 family RNA polymerase sigma factor [Clostridium sp.]|nr:sigma-70 family RNA polymerase sigma factor [Clostridium sp.]
MKQSEFCERISQYRKQLYITAYAILKNETDAEDAVCGAILNGYEHLSQLKNQHKFKAWMISITRNEALKIQQKRLELPGNEHVEQLLQPSYDDHHELWDIVQTLSEPYRMVVILFYYGDLPISDIARVLHISTGTVKSRLNRGRTLLKEALKKTGGMS